MPLCPHPSPLPGLRSHSYLLVASRETVYPASAIGDQVPTQLPDLKEELAGGEEAKMGVPSEGESHPSQTGLIPNLHREGPWRDVEIKPLFARNLSVQHAKGRGLCPDLN